MSRAQRSSSPPTIMQVRDATVGPLSGTTRCRPRARRSPRTARRARRRRSARASSACPGRSRCWRRRMRAPVAVSSSDAFEASFISPPPVKPGAVEEQRQADARVRCPATAGASSSNRDRFTASRSTGSALASLPSVWPVAVVSPGRSAFISRSADRIDAERLGDAIHVRLDRELRLRRAEAAEGAVGRRVGHHRPAADAHVIAAVRARRVNHAARQHHGAQRGVGAAVHHHVDVHAR